VIDIPIRKERQDQVFIKHFATVSKADQDHRDVSAMVICHNHQSLKRGLAG